MNIGSFLKYIILIIVLSSCSWLHQVNSKISHNFLVKHHSEELNSKESKVYSNAERLNLHSGKGIKRKVKHYLSGYFNKTKDLPTKHLFQDKRFLHQLDEYLSKLFYVDLILYKKVDYEKKNRIVRKILKEKNCELQLQLNDEQNWYCTSHFKQENDEMNFCACSYEYDCDYNEQLQLGFSTNNITENLMDEIKLLCQLNLMEQTKENWICKIEQQHQNDEYQSGYNFEDEAYCDCFAKKKCLMQKVIQEEV